MQTCFSSLKVAPPGLELQQWRHLGLQPMVWVVSSNTSKRIRMHKLECCTLYQSHLTKLFFLLESLLLLSTDLRLNSLIKVQEMQEMEISRFKFALWKYQLCLPRFLPIIVAIRKFSKSC